MSPMCQSKQVHRRLSMANSILEHFAELPDPRVERTRRHRLQDIVTIAICAVICGAEGWTDMELFGKAKESWFRTFLELPNGIPSHDTFGRVISALAPDAFERSLSKSAYKESLLSFNLSFRYPRNCKFCLNSQKLFILPPLPYLSD